MSPTLFDSESLRVVPLRFFGMHRITNRFLNSPDDPVPSYPLELSVDLSTGLVHLSRLFPVSELRPRHDWITCFEPEDHIDELARRIARLPNVNQSTNFLGFSFKDDTTLDRIRDSGFGSISSISPSLDLDIFDRLANIETVQNRFTELSADRIFRNHKRPDVFIARHVLEHFYDLPAFLRTIRTVIADTGYVVLEVPDCERGLSFGDCSVLWEEHVFYFTRNTLLMVMARGGFDVIDSFSVPYPLEDSLIIIARKNESEDHQRGFLPTSVLDAENTRAFKFVELLHARRASIVERLTYIRRNGGKVALFGAAHLSFTFVSLHGLESLIDFFIDDDSNKRDLIAPVGGVRILGSEQLYSSPPVVCLLGLNPIKHQIIVSRHVRYTDSGGIFASIFPGTPLYIEDVLPKS